MFSLFLITLEIDVAERINEKLVQMIATYAHKYHDIWKHYLKHFAWKTAMYDSTWKTAELILGRNNLTPIYRLLLVPETRSQFPCADWKILFRKHQIK